LALKRSSFTLLEIAIAMGIFAVGISALLERRNSSFEDSYVAQQTMAAMGIIDDVMADYRLHPFSEEVRALPQEYEGFTVDVTVNEESINIVPEDWRMLDDPLLPDEEEKKRVILRVGVTVSFEGISTSEQHQVSVSTLIRLIELDDDEDSAS
jgi:hypothetical protein